VKTVVPDFEEAQDTGDTLGARNGVAKDDCGLSCFLLQVVEHVDVLFIALAAESLLHQGRWHSVVLRQVDNLRVARSELNHLADSFYRIILRRLNSLALDFRL